MFDVRRRFAVRVPMAALLIGSMGLSAGVMRAQEANPTSRPGTIQGQMEQQENGTYIYRVKVVQRDLDAVNYLHRSGATHVGFKGTSLLPAASGEAKVESERGRITVDAEFHGLVPANTFGKEYLTYVLWAISPDGRPNNLGEVLPEGTKNNIHVTTALQSFGLIVTAEPYFSVSMPSDVVVVQNVIEGRTEGELEKVNAHYALLPRGMYAETAGQGSVMNPITRKERSPLELYEAHNAIRIAQAAGADKYAADVMAEAKQDLVNADGIDSNRKGDRKMEITSARQAVQRAEDARLIALRKEAAEQQQQTLDAKNQAQIQAAQSQAAAAQSQAQAQQAQMQAAEAQAAADRAAASKAQADAQRARAEADAANARAQAAEANKSAQNAQQDAAAVREKLRMQLNAILVTTETARGLIVNMSDVLFDTAKYTLKPATQVSLAKVSGILQAYPGLKLQVEGYTDSVGGDDYNQKLSENRAGAVRDFLVSQGVSMNNISAMGFGKNDPVADNGTSTGRAQNRRVQLVVSGEAIGITQEIVPEGGIAAPATVR